MAQYQVFRSREAESRALEHTDRLRRHHDHLKALDDCYTFMRQNQTYDRMKDKDLRCNPATAPADEPYYTSLIIKLCADKGADLFDGVRHAYEELEALLRHFDPEASVDVYFDSAHITVRSLEDGTKQTARELQRYLPVVAPIVRKWVRRMPTDTTLYALGLFTNLHPDRGLSVGIRFYPSLPLVQIIRGEVGHALYAQPNERPLRPEDAFHTMLTHSTGFRARNLTLPMCPTFVQAFQDFVEKYDRTVFAAITDLRAGDFYVRNGRSDKLVTNEEVQI